MQYQILTHRKALVQSNVGILNDLNSQLMEILRFGKILYQGKDAVKQQEYTLSELKKRVRRISKKDAGAPATPGTPQEK